MNIPKTVLESLDLQMLLRDALNRTSSPNPMAATIALYQVESYLAAAKRQQARMNSAHRAIEKQMRRPAEGRPFSSKPLSNLFRDIHFYLICCARLAKLARFINEGRGLGQTSRVLKRYRKDLDEAIKARDFFEHQEERLPGGKRRAAWEKMPAPNDFGNMSRATLSYGGHEINIGEQSFSTLVGFVKELRAALLYDACEALASVDRPRLEEIIHRQWRDIHLKKDIRRVERELRAAGWLQAKP